MSRTKKKVFRKLPAWKTAKSISKCDGCNFDENDNCTISDYPEYKDMTCIVNGKLNIIREVKKDDR